MSDFRYDPIFGNWVCIAESRLQRPVEYFQTIQRRPDIACPFCRGHENQTPQTLAERIGKNGWLARAFSNKYPALIPEDPDFQSGQSDHPRGGQQEVIVISPRHIVSFGELNDNEAGASLSLFQERVVVYQNDAAIRHLALFMNCRPLAGASIEHAHFQLIGAPLVSRNVLERISRGSAGSLEKLVQQERADGRRLVDESANWTIYCPYACRFAGQVRFVPRNSQPLASMRAETLAELGDGLARIVRVLDRAMDQPAYNIVFFLPPAGMENEPWFVDLIPRFPQMAGFELATDCWINPLSPESAAEKYREHR